MSEEELVRAYAAGHISRRVFVRRLVAAGVGLGAALAYGDSLAHSAFGAESPESPEGKETESKESKESYENPG